MFEFEFDIGGGKYITYRKVDGHKLNNGDVLLRYSDQGLNYELVVTRFQGTPERHSLNYVNPHNGDAGSLQRTDNVLFVNFTSYGGPAPAGSPAIVPLPRFREVLHFCRAEDGTAVCITAAKYFNPLDTCRVYLGKTASLMRRVRDEEIIILTKGDIGIRSSCEFLIQKSMASKTGPVVVWGETVMSKLNPDEYVFSEDGYEIKASRKQKC